MPSKLTFYRWLDQSAELQSRYARAKEQRVDHWSEDIIAIAKDKNLDWNRARLQVDTLKWLMSKLQPKQYGDKLQHTGADGDGPVVIKVQDEWARPVIDGGRVALEDASSATDSAQLTDDQSKEAK